jgi:competence protein ComEA
MIMNSKLRTRILYATGCVLLLCSMSPRSIFAQPSETPSSAIEHTGVAENGARPGGAQAQQSSERTGVVNINAATGGGQAQQLSVPSGERTGVVNLNTATAAELERLPRVGPARAQAILALRAQLKRFSKVEQLLRVRGIGRATFRKLRPLLALDGPTTLPERKRR